MHQGRPGGRPPIAHQGPLKQFAGRVMNTANGSCCANSPCYGAGVPTWVCLLRGVNCRMGRLRRRATRLSHTGPATRLSCGSGRPHQRRSAVASRRAQEAVRRGPAALQRPSAAARRVAAWPQLTSALPAAPGRQDVARADCHCAREPATLGRAGVVLGEPNGAPTTTGTRPQGATCGDRTCR